MYQKHLTFQEKNHLVQYLIEHCSCKCYWLVVIAITKASTIALNNTIYKGFNQLRKKIPTKLMHETT